MKASIIISTYNNLEDLRLLLPSIKDQHLDDYEAEVIIRDDGSSDTTCSWIQNNYPWVQLIKGNNVGFSRSNNIAARRATGEVLVFINADTILDRNFITAGLDIFVHEPSVGGVNSNMIMPWVMDVQMFLNGERPTAGYGYFLNRYGFADYRKVTDARCETLLLSGGGCFVRRSALDEERPFIENLWGGTAYCEDLELSLRLLAKGWRLCFVPATVLYHNQRPIQKLGWNQLKKFIRVSTNRVTVYAQHLSLPCFLRFSPRLFYGFIQKTKTLPMTPQTQKMASTAALMATPLFFLCLPYFVYRNAKSGIYAKAGAGLLIFERSS